MTKNTKLKLFRYWIVLIFTFLFLSLSAQQQPINFPQEALSVESTLTQLARQTGLKVVVDTNMDRKRSVFIPSTATTLNEVMVTLLHNTKYSYSIKDGYIIILEKNPTRNTDLTVDKIWKEGPKVYYFPIDRTMLLKDYRTNLVMLESLDALLSDQEISLNIDSVLIAGAASPIASRSHNDKLSVERANALRSYIHWKHPHVDRTKIYTYPEGIDWEGFWSIVENDSKLPSQSKVQAVKNIGNEAEMLQILRTVGGKETYEYLLNKIYPKLQYASVRIVLNDGRSIPVAGSPIKQIVLQEIAVPCDTIWAERVIRDTVYIERPDPELIDKSRKPFYIALKNNLIYDIGLLPNLGIEIPFGRNYNWSVAIEGNWSWWNTGADSYNYHRIQIAELEVRRWFKREEGQRPLTGWFAGVYGYGGTYDIRLFTDKDSDKGYLSNWSYSGGLTIGYAKSIARGFNLEFGLGLGYIGGKYYKYDIGSCPECDFPKRSTHQMEYWGPTQANVSLVWLIGGNTGKNNRKEAQE